MRARRSPRLPGKSLQVRSKAFNSEGGSIWVGLQDLDIEFESLAHYLAESQATDEWLDAELYQVYDYCRGSKSLHLPPELKQHLPVR